MPQDTFNPAFQHIHARENLTTHMQHRSKEPMTNLFDLSGRLALVTGASSGLGEHFARTLARNGADVILAARRLEKLQALSAEIEQETGRRAFPVAMDVTDMESVTAAFASAQAEFGRPADVIINNSGMSREAWSWEMDEADWNAVIDTNLTGVWRVAKTAANALIDAKTPGSIVNIASITALRTDRMLTAYGSSKAAVDHLTRNMAMELARHSIRMNAIAPGYFSTEINADYLAGEHGQQMRKRVAMRRFGEYRELEGALLLLASDAGSYMTGATLVVDGGHTLLPL